MIRKCLAVSLSATLVLSGCSSTTPLPSLNPPAAVITPTTSAKAIKHVVVIFQENVSFDHYFGTYPNAANLPGEPSFTAAAGTPTNIANYVSSPGLLTNNPNTSVANGAGASNPYRLARRQAATADQNHNYGAEELAYDGGKMDLFPLSVGVPDSSSLATSTGASAISASNALNMAYYDGNTVTALWNYAQHYAMNDHSFSTTFGPSTPGALNLVAGQTNGVTVTAAGAASSTIADGQGGLTLISDSDPTYDICSSASSNVSMSAATTSAAAVNKNIGDLLNIAGISWGFFEGGFNLSATNSNGTTGCARSTTAVSYPGTKADYIPHHQPFQYYASTANPTHIRPASVAAIGAETGPTTANHQYDMTDFDAALAAGNLPAVSFLKASGFQDGHAGYSDPLDEQTFIVNEINAIQASPFWSSTAIIIAYDDSDGWYDHVPNLINGSATTADSVNGTGICISNTAAAAALPGPNSAGKPVQGRCGYGPRQPLLVISPWANGNYIDNTVTDQASILRFIEDTFVSGTRIGGGSFDAIAGSLNGMFNFSNGAAPPNPTPLYLSPSTGKACSPSTSACS
ncbi:MAG TPA: alkaline phosphatase family protein [Acidobacteriaceae bacterium]|nr:alkaline phosphatase family protein [Acidobacteriaceae bacterium]